MTNKLTKETEFPRSWEDVETSISFITQPYISNLYLAGTKKGRNVFQGSISWNKLAKTIKSFRKMEVEGKITNLCVQTVGRYLTEDDLNIINS